MQVEVFDGGCTCSIRHTILFVDLRSELFGWCQSGTRRAVNSKLQGTATGILHETILGNNDQPLAPYPTCVKLVLLLIHSASLRLARLSLDYIHSHQFHQPPWPA
jgi:hypothetical protein